MKKTLLLSLAIIFSLQVNAQRNVILIIADDLGTDYFGFYPDHVDTASIPNISWLASKGIVFNNAMSNPVCSPTRAGILTGRYSFRTGVGYIVGATGGSGQLDTSEITIPKLLNIYNPNIGKANIGKWHLHTTTPPTQLSYPNTLGYDHFEGPFIGALTNYYSWVKYTNGVSSNVTNYATSENVDNAVAWLKTQNANPVFLWMAFNAPHEPLHLPPAGTYTNTTLTGTPQDINTKPKQYFKALIEALDHEIGRLFDSLQVLNRLDSTDFIFIGDNGNTQKTAQIPVFGHAKTTVYQYGVHVPFIVSGPSVVNPGRASDALVNTADIFATVLELFGYTNWQTQIPVNKPVDSKSVFPIINNQNVIIRPWSFCELFKVQHDSTEAKGIRNIDYKLINYDYGLQKFYNLSVDSLELNNLLTGTMSATDIVNYNYLCNELTNLIGTGNYCTATIGVNETTGSNAKFIYPNPFTTHLKIHLKMDDDSYELNNSLGQLIYTGREIESTDFSKIPNGIYFLTIINNSKSTLKLVKQ